MSRGRFALVVLLATAVAVSVALLVPYHEGAEYCGSVLRSAQTEDSGPCVSAGGSHLLAAYALAAGIPYFAVMARLILAKIRRRRGD